MYVQFNREAFIRKERNSIEMILSDAYQEEVEGISGKTPVEICIQ